ncbi:Protein C43E11.12 b [Aphelenchoides avenae]|nr:Protein C43E11.12 b [Aphelenchus avenae]
MSVRPSTSAADTDEYETETVVVELNGVLDADAVRNAVQSGNVAVRKADGAKPLVQVGSTLYTGEWKQTVGTDLIFYQADPAQPLELISAADTRLSAQKALITTIEAPAEGSVASKPVPRPMSTAQAKGSPPRKKASKSPTKAAK